MGKPKVIIVVVVKKWEYITCALWLSIQVHVLCFAGQLSSGKGK